MENKSPIEELIEKVEEMEIIMDKCHDDSVYLAKEYLQQLQEELESLRDE